MNTRKYTRRSPGDVVNGAVLLRRVNTRLWEMQCQCGNVFISQPSCTSGKCESCGRKQAVKTRTLHGESPTTGKNATRLYGIWIGMRNRCRNPKNHGHPSYGGRGISVCEEWDSYAVFKEWALSHGYSDDLSLDRIDCDGNYSPENCKWSTAKEQGRNKHNNKVLTFNGETKTLAEWAECTGINYHTLKHRLFTYGFTVEDALTKPVRNGKNQRSHTQEQSCVREEENK